MAMSRPLQTDDLMRGLECSVCHEHFRSPKVLPCGHTFCLSPCLEQISNEETKMHCPECRMEHTVPEGGVKNFSTNVSMARLFETSHFSTKFSGCLICGESEELDLVKCLHCSLMMCDDCKHNHSLKFRDEIIKVLVALKGKASSETNNARDEQRKQAESLIKENVDLALEKIQTIGEKAHVIINNKVEDLINSVREYETEEMKNVNCCDEEIQQSHQNVSRFCDDKIVDLKRKIPAQAKMFKVMSTLRTKQLLVSENKRKFSTILRDINIATNLIPLEKATNELGNIIVHSPTSDVDARTEDVDSTPSLTHFMPESILTRDFSSVKLCIGSEGSGDSNLKNPFGVGVDPVTKDVIVADCGNNRVQVFDKEGQPKMRFGSQGTGKNDFQHPSGIAVTSEGQIVISDTNNHRVKVYTREGNLVHVLGMNGTSQGQLSYPYGVSVDNSANIHVCDYGNKRIQVFDKTGHYKYLYHTWRSVYDEKPLYISIHQNGNIGVILENKRIAVLNSQTQLLHSFSPSDPRMLGIAWVDEKHVIVSEYIKDVICVYTMTGELVRQFGESGYHVGQLKGPQSVAVDDEGFVYVSCYDNHMVQKF